LLLGFFHRHRGAAAFGIGLAGFASLEALSNQFRNGSVDRAGVGLFLSDTEFGQHLEDDVRGNLELPG
jgi:hypothetical protein